MSEDLSSLLEQLKETDKYWYELLVDTITKAKDRLGIPEADSLSRLHAIYITIPETVFRNPLDRLKYAIKYFRIEVSQKLAIPTIKIIVIPIGVSSVMFSKTRGEKTGLAPALLYSGDNVNLVLLRFRDAATEYLDKIKPGIAYIMDAVRIRSNVYVIPSNARVDVYKDKDGNTMVVCDIDDIVNKPCLDTWKQYFGLKEFQLRDTRKNASRKVGNYMDSLDMKLYRGLITDARVLTINGIRVGRYIVSDETAAIGEELDEEDMPIPSSGTIWVHPRLLRYGSKSEIIALGTVRYDVKTDPDNPDKVSAQMTMNAYWIFPGRIYVEISPSG